MKKLPEDHRDWLAGFLRELITMPRRHVIVFFLATILLLVLEIELTEGVHLVHVLEVLGVAVFLYLAWAAWRSGWSRGAPVRR